MKTDRTFKGEWNHSCSAGSCGNCGNPGNTLVPVTVDGTDYVLTPTGVGILVVVV